MNNLQNENNFKQNIIISEGQMKNELLMLPLSHDIHEWSFIKRFKYEEREQIIEHLKLTELKTVKDAFSFIAKNDVANFTLTKKEQKSIKNKNHEEQKHIKTKIKNSIFTSFLIDALKNKYGENYFLNRKMIIDINDDISQKSKIFNVYNVANINASIKDDEQATVNISFAITIDFCCDILLKQYIDVFQNYLNLKNKSLPGIFTTKKGKKCKVKIKSIIPLSKITSKEKNELKKYEHMESDNLSAETLFARVEFYNDGYSFIVSLDTLKLSIGSDLLTMYNEYNKNEQKDTLNPDVKNILNEYSQLRNKILDASKSFSLRTNKLEYFINNTFNKMINFNNVEAEICPANYYKMDRRLNKKSIIDIILIIDPHSKHCDFYKNKIHNLKPYSESNIKINIHFIEYPLFMYNKEKDAMKENNEKKYLFMFKQFRDYLNTKIEKLKIDHNMKNPVAWIFWPRRFDPNSRNIFEEYFEEYDYDMEKTLSKINYKTPATYVHNSYHLPKIFLEYDLLSVIPVQNTWESYNDDDFKDANFQGTDMKFRNIIEGIITQSETLNDQLQYLQDNNILTVDIIYSLDVNRNMKEFSQELACHCCQFLPIVNDVIPREYEDTAISMAKIYAGKGEERNKDEIKDFYYCVNKKLNEYNIKIRNKFFLRDGILYENINEIKEILKDNTVILQVKKSNIASYVDPNQYMSNYSFSHKTFLYEQKDGKKRYPNRYLLYVNNNSYPELSKNDFIFGASCKVMAYKKNNNDHDEDKHCRSLHVANIIFNNTNYNTNDVMKTIGMTCLSNTTTAEGFCMLPYAQKMADRIPYYFIKDGNLESRLSRYVEMDGEINPKQKILDSFNDILTVFGSNMWV